MSTPLSATDWAATRIAPSRARARGELWLSTGDILGGQYRVERTLGEGGMGVVVAATHLGRGELVALKIMRPEIADDPSAVTRFLREARASARLSGDHVARVIDVITVEPGVPCIVMEYLEGSDFAALLEQRGRLALEEAVELALQSCGALAEAHAAGIVHRDLKPANLFLTRRADGAPCVKVLDFGISKIQDPQDLRRMTGACETMGSPLYVAPEQMISARDADARADVWALGVILYELTTGKSPFAGRTATHVCANVLQCKYAPATSLVPELGPRFDAIVARCLTRDPGARYQTVADLARALEKLRPNRARPAANRGSSSRSALAWVWLAALGVGAVLALTLSPRGSPRPLHALHVAPALVETATFLLVELPEPAEGDDAVAVPVNDLPDFAPAPPASTAPSRGAAGRAEHPARPRAGGKRINGRL